MSILRLFKNSRKHPNSSQDICSNREYIKKSVPEKRLSYQAANLQGIGKRERQEDAFTFENALDVTMSRKNGMLSVVADGMGGMADGKWAGESTVASIKASFFYMNMSEDICLQLEESVRKASGEVFEKLKGMGGSTVIACIFYQEELYFVSVGDSSLYLRRNGRMFKLNQEQNMKSKKYLEQIRSGILIPQKAREDPEAATLTQFIGMEELDWIDSSQKPLPLMDGDTIMLCTDGIAGVLEEEKIEQCLSKNVPEEICDALEKEIQKQDEPYQDNYTALIITCGY